MQLITQLFPLSQAEPQINESLLSNIFSTHYGAVADCLVKRYSCSHHPTERQSGYGFVFFRELPDALRAVEQLTGNQASAHIDGICFDCKVSRESMHLLVAHQQQQTRMSTHGSTTFEPAAVRRSHEVSPQPSIPSTGSSHSRLEKNDSQDIDVRFVRTTQREPSAVPLPPPPTLQHPSTTQFVQQMRSAVVVSPVQLLHAHLQPLQIHVQKNKYAHARPHASACTSPTLSSISSDDQLSKSGVSMVSPPRPQSLPYTKTTQGAQKNQNIGSNMQSVQALPSLQSDESFAMPQPLHPQVQQPQAQVQFQYIQQKSIPPVVQGASMQGPPAMMMHSYSMSAPPLVPLTTGPPATTSSTFQPHYSLIPPPLMMIPPPLVPSVNGTSCYPMQMPTMQYTSPTHVMHHPAHTTHSPQHMQFMHQLQPQQQACMNVSIDSCQHAYPQEQHPQQQQYMHQSLQALPPQQMPSQQMYAMHQRNYQQSV